MAAVAGAFVLRNSSVKFDATEFNNQLSKARLVPDSPVQQLRVLDPTGTLTDVDSAVWTFEIGGPQVWTTGGLADFMNDNAGTVVEVVYQPRKGTGQAIATFEVTCVPMEFGGEQGAYNTFDISLPVLGSPVWSVSV
jgi:hypothetical protein